MKTSLAGFGREKSVSWRHHDAAVRASTRIEFQEALIRFSKLGFPVAHIQYVIFQNKFGYASKICDRLWFEGDLKNLVDDSVEFVRTFLQIVFISDQFFFIIT